MDFDDQLDCILLSQECGCVCEVLRGEGRPSLAPLVTWLARFFGVAEPQARKEVPHFPNAHRTGAARQAVLEGSIPQLRLPGGAVA
jgi:hypothetical protein